MGQVEEQGEASTTSNPMERIENVEALAIEAKNGAALNDAIVEVEAMGAIMTEADAEILTIESSLEWGGTLIEEEIEMAETREFTEEGHVPSISIAKLRNPCTTEQEKKIKRISTCIMTREEKDNQNCHSSRTITGKMGKY